MNTVTWIGALLFVVCAVVCVAWSVKARELGIAVFALLPLIVAGLILYLGNIQDNDDKAADRAAAAAKRDNDKARLYFVTHYPDLRVLEFDTYQGLVRYERKEPRRVCKASLIQDGKIFLLGDDETCPVQPQGG